MHVIDEYLTAHARYVEALEALDAFGALLRDVGEQLLANPQYVHFENDGLWLEKRVNGWADDPSARSPWPTPDRIQQAIDRLLAAKAALVIESEKLVDARAPDVVKDVVATRR